MYYLNPHNKPQGRFSLPPFIGEQTKAQSGRVNCSRSHRIPAWAVRFQGPHSTSMLGLAFKKDDLISNIHEFVDIYLKHNNKKKCKILQLKMSDLPFFFIAHLYLLNFRQSVSDIL